MNTADIESLIGPVAATHSLELDRVEAVSYTHLDVYKRQPQDGASRIREKIIPMDWVQSGNAV